MYILALLVKNVNHKWLNITMNIEPQNIHSPKLPDDDQKCLLCGEECHCGDVSKTGLCGSCTHQLPDDEED